MLWKVPSVWTVPNLDQCNISTGILPIYTVNWRGATVKYLAKRSLRAFRHSETWFNPVLFTFSFGTCTHYCGRNPRTNRRCKIQYIPRNMHTVFALLCFVVVIHWLIFPFPSGLLHWHCGNLTIAPVPAKQPWWIWINTSCEFIMNDCITTTKQSTTKPCAYFLGYTVLCSCVKCVLTIGRTNLAQRQPGFIVCMRPTNERRRYTVTTVTSLHCNVVSHWMGAYTPWALQQHLIILIMVISRMLNQWRFPILNQWSNTMWICGIGDSF